MLVAKRQDVSKGEADKGKMVQRKPEERPPAPINSLWHHFATSVPGVQAKLKIGQPGDQYEQEADRVAEQVMRMPEPSIRRKPSCPFVDGSRCGEEELTLQTKSAGSAGTARVDHPLINSVLASPGRPLDAETRNFMEPRFGQDFSGVRVHTDEQAAESARAVNANAYTVGNKIVFSKDKYFPETSAGRQLVAHELTHTIQQGNNFIQNARVEKTSIQRDKSTEHIIERDRIMKEGEKALDDSKGDNNYNYIDKKRRSYFIFLDNKAQFLLEFLIFDWLKEKPSSMLVVEPYRYPLWFSKFREKIESPDNPSDSDEKKIAEKMLGFVLLKIPEEEQFRMNLVDATVKNKEEGKPVYTQKEVNEKFKADRNWTSCIDFTGKILGSTSIPNGGKLPDFKGIGYFEISKYRMKKVVSDDKERWVQDTTNPYPNFPKDTWVGLWQGNQYLYAKSELKERPQPGDFIITMYNQREELKGGNVVGPGYFKHISILEKIKRPNQEDREEIWTTLSGGQETMKADRDGRIAKPAKRSTGIFNPKTGLFCGEDDKEKKQCTRLHGWIDIAAFYHEKQPTEPLIQTKLKVRQPGDKYEQEADRVAEQVMQMPELQVVPEEDTLQAKSVDGGRTTSAQIDHPAIQNVLASPGQPLDAATRSFMETRFGQDFSGVRVHTDGKAAESTRAIQARAYTAGQNVVFGGGEYDPESPEGRRLLAHELTHVVQQGAAIVQRKPNLHSSQQDTDLIFDVQRSTNKTTAEKLMPLLRGLTKAQHRSLATTLRWTSNIDRFTRPPVQLYHILDQCSQLTRDIGIILTQKITPVARVNLDPAMPIVEKLFALVKGKVVPLEEVHGMVEGNLEKIKTHLNSMLQPVNLHGIEVSDRQKFDELLRQAQQDPTHCIPGTPIVVEDEPLFRIQYEPLSDDAKAVARGIEQETSILVREAENPYPQLEAILEDITKYEPYLADFALYYRVSNAYEADLKGAQISATKVKMAIIGKIAPLQNVLSLVRLMNVDLQKIIQDTLDLPLRHDPETPGDDVPPFVASEQLIRRYDGPEMVDLRGNVGRLHMDVIQRKSDISDDSSAETVRRGQQTGGNPPIAACIEKGAFPLMPAVQPDSPMIARQEEPQKWTNLVEDLAYPETSDPYALRQMRSCINPINPANAIIGGRGMLVAHADMLAMGFQLQVISGATRYYRHPSFPNYIYGVIVNDPEKAPDPDPETVPRPGEHPAVAEARKFVREYRRLARATWPLYEKLKKLRATGRGHTSEYQNLVDQSNSLFDIMQEWENDFKTNLPDWQAEAAGNPDALASLEELGTGNVESLCSWADDFDQHREAADQVRADQELRESMEKLKEELERQNEKVQQHDNEPEIEEKEPVEEGQ